MAKPAAAVAPAGMEKAELRKFIVLARKAPVTVAFALGADGHAIVLMDKHKPARAVEKELKAQAPDARNYRFGTIGFLDDQPDLARMMVNRACNGMAKKLVLALKGTGVRHVEIASEDGGPAETAGDDEGDEMEAAAETDADDDAGQDEATQSIPSGGVMIEEMSSRVEMRDDAPIRDAAAMTSELTALVKRMMAVIAKDPAQKTTLGQLATDAHGCIKQGDDAGADAGIGRLAQALDACEGGGMPGASFAAPPAAPAKEAVVRYEKCRKVWVSTRARIDADVRKLIDAIVAIDTDGIFDEELERSFLDAVDPVLSTLDDSLADTIDQLANATDPATAARLVEQARTTIDSYKEFIADSDIIGELDGNPFMPMAIGKMLTASLSALSASIR